MGILFFQNASCHFFPFFFHDTRQISIWYHKKIKVKIFCHGHLHWVMISKHGVPKINALQLHLRGIYFGITLLLPCYPTPMWQPTHPPSLAFLPTHSATHLLACNMAIYNGLHSVGFGVYVTKTQISLVVFFSFSLCAINFQGRKLLVMCDVLSL